VTNVRFRAAFSTGNASERQYSHLIAVLAGVWSGRSGVAYTGVLQSIAQYRVQGRKDGALRTLKLTPRL
jgi:hypothetical protein